MPLTFSVDLGMACLALPRIFTTLSQLWLSDKTEVTSAVAHAFKNLLKDAVAPACDTPQLVEQHRSKLLKCFSIIEGCLKYQYNTVWHQVLHVISIMFEVCTTFYFFQCFIFYCSNLFYETNESTECFMNLSWVFFYLFHFFKVTLYLELGFITFLKSLSLIMRFLKSYYFQVFFI